LIALFTLRAVKRQADLMESQLVSANDAATAALLQAKHTETTERAWIIASPQAPSPAIPADPQEGMRPMLTSVSILFENKGKTPGFITKIATGGCAIPRFQMPDFADTQQSGELGEIPVVPGHSFGWEHERIQIERAIKIRSGKLCLWLHGIVTYKDTFGEKRDTGFCFRFEPVDGVWLISGKPGDNWAK
jgi:hypothetical protein